MPQNWNILHTRFASSIRDSVASATTNGGELTVADRDAYLIYAYMKYIRLISIHNPDAVSNILSELFKTVTVAPVSGVMSLPDDFGYFIGIGSYTDGVVVNKPSPEDFIRIKHTSTHQAAPSDDNVYISLRGREIYILPDSNTYQYEVGYIVLPKNIQTSTPESADDIVIRSEHWDTIIQLARASYFRDKSEFNLAQSIENDAILNSPFNIGVPNGTSK